MSKHEVIPSPTDLLRRRTPLLFSGRFLCLGISVTIHTDSPAILSTAEEAGFLPQSSAGGKPEMRWEIVTEEARLFSANDWTCKVTVDNHSLFLTMGTEQWFAFDFETGDGAGFVSVSNPSARGDHNEGRYLSEVARNVANCLRAELGKGRWS